jgi:UDP-N-acetylglucosamine 2-epimerase
MDGTGTFADTRKNVLELINTELENGKRIYDLTEYDGIGLWWFCHFDLIDVLSKLTQSKSEAKTGNIKFQSLIAKTPFQLFSFTNLLFDKLRKTISGSSLKKTEIPAETDKKTVLFTSEDLMWQNKIDWETKNSRKTDIFFERILRSAKNSEIRFIGTYPLIKYIYPFDSALKAFRILKEKISSDEFDYVPFNYYWDVSVLKKEKQARYYFADTWKEISESQKFNNLLEKYDKNIADTMRIKIRFYFLILLPYAVKRIEIAKNQLNHLNPDLVLFINEYGIFERSLMIVAKENNIPTAAVQHGEIVPTHQGYFSVKDLSEIEQKANPIIPVADKTFIWGQNYKDVLVSLGYSQDSVEITGSPKYDEISDIIEKQDKKQVLKEYSIEPKGRKLVLWTTQCLGLTVEENIKNFKAMVSAADSLDMLVLIKQHPREELKYDKMIEKYMLPHPNIQLLPKNAHTLSLINISDIVITKFSTTALETLAFDKELIILNLSNESDRITYVKDGVAAGAYTDQQLIEVINQTLENKNDKSEKRKDYLEKFLYKIDGQASKRIINEISKLLKTV